MVFGSNSFEGRTLSAWDEAEARVQRAVGDALPADLKLAATAHLVSAMYSGEKQKPLGQVIEDLVFRARAEES